MRVTDKMTYEVTTRRLNDLRQNVAKAQEQAITQRRVQVPSDDPLAVAHARSEKMREETAGEHQRVIDAGLASLQASDSALNHVGDVLIRIRELTIQAANDTNGAQQRADIATEISALRDTLVGLANTQHQGRYVFAGFVDDTPPFDAAGTYYGDTNVRQLEAAPGVQLDAALTGDQVFAPASGVNLFAEIQALVVALQANNKAGIQGALDTLDIAQQQISTSRAELGAQVQALELAHEVAGRVKDESAVAQTDLLGIEPVDAYQTYLQAQQVLQAAIEIARQIPPFNVSG